MREIDFRAWDKQTRDMLELYPSSMEFYNKRLQTYRPFYSKHIIRLQYTGLKDRDGREIYEGDIIQDDDGFFWRVYFEDGKFRARGGEYEEVDDLNEFCPYWCEVVGNIYENPELEGGE